MPCAAGTEQQRAALEAWVITNGADGEDSGALCTQTVHACSTSMQRPEPATTSINADEPVVLQVGQLGQHYWDWVNRPEPGQPRFFRSSFVEHCSKTPWWVVPALWLPIFATCMAHCMRAHGLLSAEVVSWAFVGIVAWQLMEYAIHRFVFHGSFTSYWGITFHFLFHGCHHKYPMDRLRLVFPPVPASIVIAAVYVILHAAMPAPQALALFAGMGLGYVLYDCLHYALHHNPTGLPGPLLQDLRRRHVDHHYRDHSKGYGISSTAFDVLFCTSSKCC